MNIEEEQIEGLDNKPPVFKQNKYPVLKNPNVIGAPYSIVCVIGQRAQGKSYMITKFLQNISDSGLICPVIGEKCEIRIFLFCPTVEGNPIFKTLKYLDDQDIHTEFTDQKLYDVLNEIKAYNDSYKAYLEYASAYIKYEKMSDSQLKKSTDYEMLSILSKHNFMDYRKLQKIKPRVNYIILDDCLSSKDFSSNKRSSVLVRSVLNSRHLNCNIIIAGQHIRAINKQIRLNTDIWILYRFKNDKILLNDLYEEISAEVTPDEFLNLYHYATEEDHSALVYNGKAKRKEDRFMKNLDKIIRLK